MPESNIPRVSVLVPAYNREKSISETIQSILDQTYTDFELLICDDGSRDRTVEIIESFDDPRIRLIRNETNLGSPRTRNRLLDNARGEYIAVMDSDDICYPYRLEIQINYLDKHPDIDICTGVIDIIDDDGNLTGRQIYNGYSDDRIFKARMLFWMSFAQQTLMFRRKHILDHGIRYEERSNGADDYTFYLSAYKYSVFHNLQIPLVKYRVWNSQMSSNIHNKQFDNAIKTIITLHKQVGYDMTDADEALIGRLHRTNLSKLSWEEMKQFEQMATKIIRANEKNQSGYDPSALIEIICLVYKKRARGSSKLRFRRRLTVGLFIRRIRKLMN